MARLKVRHIGDVAVVTPHGYLMGGEETDELKCVIDEQLAGGNRKLLIARGVEAAFDHPATDEEREIQKLIAEHRADEALVYQRTLFEQRTRLVEARQRLQTKFTKKASEDERIAAKKVDWARDKLADLQCTEALAEDDRIYPGTYAPVMVVENGQRISERRGIGHGWPGSNR